MLPLINVEFKHPLKIARTAKLAHTKKPNIYKYLYRFNQTDQFQRLVLVGRLKIIYHKKNTNIWFISGQKQIKTSWSNFMYFMRLVITLPKTGLGTTQELRHPSDNQRLLFIVRALWFPVSKAKSLPHWHVFCFFFFSKKMFVQNVCVGKIIT